jgi:hypothetical protein
MRIVGELKQSKEQYKRDTAKLTSERDTLEDAGSSTASICFGIHEVFYLTRTQCWSLMQS